MASYYRARYYDPQAGRFSSEDPINFRSGINFYPYVKNGAVNWRDPRGRGPDPGILSGIWNHAVGFTNWVQCSITASYCLSGLQEGVASLANLANFNKPSSQIYDSLFNTADATHQATMSSLMVNQFCAANPHCMVAFESCLGAAQANPLPTPNLQTPWPSPPPGSKK